MDRATLYCSEIQVMAPHIVDGCITNYLIFPLICLHRDQLEVHARYVGFYNPMYLDGDDDHNR